MSYTELLDFLSRFLFDPDRLPYAAGAVMVCMIVGVVTGARRSNANPLLWTVFDSVFGNLGAKLDRKNRKVPDLIMRGAIVTFVCVFLAYVLGRSAEKFASAYPFYGAVEVFCLSIALTAGAVWRSLLRLYKALDKGDMAEGAYRTIATSTRNNLNNSDDFGITRIGMGFMARRFHQGMVAPVLWYFFAGLSGAYMYAMLATLSWRFGKEGATKGFGALPLALEKLLGYIPDLFAAFLISLAGLFTPTGGMTRAFIGHMVGGKGRAPYEQGGKSLTALAYGLKVSLGGPSKDIDGMAIKRAWVGPEGATAQLGAGHLKRAIYIGFVANLLFLASIVSAILWASFLFG